MGRVALLEIGPPAATNEQAITGKGHALVVEHESGAAIGMAGRGNRRDMAIAESQRLAVREVYIRTLRPGALRQGDPAAEPLLQQPGPGHVVSMDMGFEAHDEAQAELLDQGDLARHLLEHRIDEDCLAACTIGKQIGVGRALLVEQLAEYQHVTVPLALQP